MSFLTPEHDFVDCVECVQVALAVAALLVVRTWIDVRMLHLTTTVERHIVSRNGSK